MPSDPEPLVCDRLVTPTDEGLARDRLASQALVGFEPADLTRRR
jgi:hypothetical protein